MKTQQPSPEKVLAILVDEHRIASPLDPEMDPAAILTFDTTVAEWRDACDLLEWQTIADALNQVWGIKAEWNEWEAVLEPADQRTLRDVCGLISKYAQIQDLPDHAPLGGRCGAARAFLAIREILVSLGVPRAELQPSTLLAPYLDRFKEPLIYACMNLSPGKLPAIVFRGGIHDACQLTGSFALLVTVTMGWYSDLIQITSFWLFILAFGISYLPHPLFRGHMEIPGLITLKDLAERLGTPPNRDDSA